MSIVVTEEDIEEFLLALAVTDEQIAQARACAQRSEEWHKWRKNRMTMSMAGAAAGHNKHRSPMELIRELLWPFFKGNNATEYGTIFEPTATHIVQIVIDANLKKLGYQRGWVQETGTEICKQHPWLAASSDGLIFGLPGPDGPQEMFRGTLEIKCPFTKKFYTETPHYYYDQFMGTAAILGVDKIVFGIYTPTKTQVNYYDFEPEYWHGTLLPALRSFYMEEFIHRAIWKERGLLEENCIDPKPIVTIQPSTLRYCTQKRSHSASANGKSDLPLPKKGKLCAQADEYDLVVIGDEPPSSVVEEIEEK